MTVLHSIVLLLSVVCAVAFPLFFGNALATHSLFTMVLAFVFLALAAALFWLQVRVIRPREPHLP